jgi:hypothetical protein
MNLNSKNKFYISLSIFLSIFAIFLFFIWLSFGVLKGENKNLIESQSYLLELEKKKEKISEAFLEYNASKDSIDTLNSALLSNDQDLNLVILIENTAKANMLNHEIMINDVRNKRSKDPRDINFQVNLSGSFLGVMNFIKYMEEAPYYLNIKNISLDRVSSDLEAGGRGKLTFPLKENDVRASLIIKVYTYSQKK